MISGMTESGNRPAPSPGRRAAKPPRYRNKFSSEVPLGDGRAIFYYRREVHPPRKKPITFRDIRELLLFGFYLCVAAAVPVAYWDGICRFVALLRIRKYRRKLFKALERDLASIAPAANPEEYFIEYLTSMQRRRLYYMAHIAGWHWKPTIIVEGDEEIGRAASRGRGVLIWCANLAAQTLIGKRALHQAGIEVYQLNAREHGASTTAFGKRMINPIMLAVENRFLKGRIAFDASESIYATRRVLQALRANSVVAIAANTYSGRRFVQLPIGARGYAHFATAPANFAARGETTLLTMETVETVPFTEFRAVIRSHAVPEENAPRDHDAAIAGVVSALRDSLENTAVNFPGQCLGIGRDLVCHSLDEHPGFRQ